ncbi:MAG: hypothetical protein HZA50_06990 [Planctomycetes bacterium]|nr:hypothetical protein [Planctomycetota bacterium]
MRKIVLAPMLMAALGLAAAAAVAGSGDAGEKKPVMLYGKIVKAADEKGVLVILPKDKTDVNKDGVKVATDDKTVVMIDGKEARPANLKEGDRVKVTIVAGVAERIEKVRAETPKAGA